MKTEAEINEAITRNVERRWIVGVQGDDLIVQHFGERGAIRVNAQEWDDLKTVIDSLIPAVKYA